MLRRVDGPECPKCGCRDSKPIPRSAGGFTVFVAGEKFGSAAAQHECQNCYARFTPEGSGGWAERLNKAAADRRALPKAAPIEPAELEVEDEAPESAPVQLPSEPIPGVAYQRTACPACRSTNTRVRSTQGKVRYHACRDCGQRFKSTEH